MKKTLFFSSSHKYHYVCREEGGGIPGDGWDDGGPDGSAAPW